MNENPNPLGEEIVSSSAPETLQKPENLITSQEVLKTDLTRKADEQQQQYIELTKRVLGKFTDPITQQQREITQIDLNEQKYRIPVAERPVILSEAQKLLSEYHTQKQEFEDIVAAATDLVKQQNLGAASEIIESELAETIPYVRHRREMYKQAIDDLNRAVKALESDYDTIAENDKSVDDVTALAEHISASKDQIRAKLDQGDSDLAAAMKAAQEALRVLSVLLATK